MEEVTRKLKEIDAKRIFVQFPEGLKMEIQRIYDELQSNGFEVLLCTEPTFGACDVRDEEAIRLGCDAILHIGHSDFGIRGKLPVIYWEYFYNVNPLPILRKNVKKLKDYKRIGLITSVQFVKALGSVKEYLEKIGKEVFVTKELKYPGQILGCNVRAALKLKDKVDCFLYVGAGKFHALGVALRSEKPVLVLDVEKGEIYEVKGERERVLKVIEWNKWKFKDSKRVGLIVSWKKGQVRDFSKVKERIERMGKKVYVLTFDEVKPEKLEGLKLDFLVNLACPRLGIDDLSRFKVPILNYESLKEVVCGQEKGSQA